MGIGREPQTVASFLHRSLTGFFHALYLTLSPDFWLYNTTYGDPSVKIPHSCPLKPGALLWAWIPRGLRVKAQGSGRKGSQAQALENPGTPELAPERRPFTALKRVWRFPLSVSAGIQNPTGAKKAQNAGGV